MRLERDRVRKVRLVRFKKQTVWCCELTFCVPASFPPAPRGRIGIAETATLVDVAHLGGVDEAQRRLMENGVE